MTLQPVIKWSGSKRNQANEIIKTFPKNYNEYYEPFIGGGSILGALNPEKAIAGDTCAPLIELWNKIKNNPKDLSKNYENNWLKLQKDHDYYYEVRGRFNQENNPDDFLFLTRTAYNGLIRFNSTGEFNTALHTNRAGIQPEKLDTIIMQWSDIVKNVEFVHSDCLATIESARKNDLVYLDPPYAHTKGMYGDKFTVENLYEILEELNSKQCYWVLSFDGKTNYKDNTVPIPKDLYKEMFYTKEYKSSLSRLKGNKNTKVRESLYKNF